MSVFSIIITAGGIGRRMGGDLPKQFLEIGGKPILMHTLKLFHSYDSTAQLVLTLPEEWKLFWEDLLLKHKCEIPHSIVDGGKERYFSVKNALKTPPPKLGIGLKIYQNWWTKMTIFAP